MISGHTPKVAKLFCQFSIKPVLDYKGTKSIWCCPMHITSVFLIPYTLTINTSPHGFWIIANILNNACPYSLTVFFQVFLHFMCSKMKKILIVLIVGKTVHKKQRETHWSFPLFSLIGLTNQKKLWLVSSEDTSTNSGGLEVDKFISLVLL